MVCNTEGSIVYFETKSSHKLGLGGGFILQQQQQHFFLQFLVLLDIYITYKNLF
jgi:hypothetical protein